jgi:uncharacterized protein YqjF (DUF2071 family)
LELTGSAFLKAEWRKLTIANYEVNPALLAKYLPSRTELDFWKGRCYVSLVGFMFLNTSIKGIKIPLHINFEEVNLRFYVTHQNSIKELKRGVVFIKEIVPRPALTFVANSIYNENYQTLPMTHHWEFSGSSWSIGYQWKLKRWNSFSVQADVAAININEGSEEEFITEHYWGYTRINPNKTSEYEVQHPRWQVYPVKEYQIDVEFGALYGTEFEFLKSEKPRSVFLAEGSEIAVKGGTIIR